MPSILHFTGFIKGVTYKAFLTSNLSRVSFDEFDVNRSSACGIIQTQDTEIAYSKWVSPKRTRSYPFARIYNTYNASKVLTIIPIIKDEGKDGDLDKLQYSTISWMNLLNTYIVLGYYNDTEKSHKKDQSERHKLTQQKFDNNFIKAQIQQISEYRQSALHWNKNLFEDSFTDTFNKALRSYNSISEKTGVEIHSHRNMEAYIDAINRDFEEFKNISLKGSQNESKREAVTSHELEYLIDGLKATFCIENYLGGVYYLTPDEILQIEKSYIIQESKNSTNAVLPSVNDIQDGLFKLILFSNIGFLKLNDEKVDFCVRLKLTGRNIKDRILLPCPLENAEKFLESNSAIFKRQHKDIIMRLLQEAQHNNIQIEIIANHEN
jgi:hypothetical protein